MYNTLAILCGGVTLNFYLAIYCERDVFCVYKKFLQAPKSMSSGALQIPRNCLRRSPQSAASFMEKNRKGENKQKEGKRKGEQRTGSWGIVDRRPCSRP